MPAIASEPLGSFLRLKSLVDSLSPENTVADVAETIAASTLSTMGADMGVVALLSKDGNMLDALVQQGVDAADLSSWLTIPMSAPIPMTVCIRQRTTLSFESQEDLVKAFPSFTTSGNLLAGAAVVVPLVLQDRDIGAIGLSYHTRRTFADWEIAFLETAAAQCAQAIDRARHLESRILVEAELARQRANNILRRLVDCITDSVVAFDADMNLLAFNTTFARLFKMAYHIQVEVGMNMINVLADRRDAYESVALNSKRAFSGETFSSVREVASENFPTQFFETTYSSLLDKDGEIAGSIHVSRNVSQRVRAEHALTRSLAQLADAQTVAKIGSWTVDVASDKHDWSDEMFRLLEFDPADGIPPPEKIVARYRPEGRPPDSGLKQTGWAALQPYALDSRLYLPDGREKWVHRIGRSQTDPEGKVVTVLGTVMDITDRKLAERELNVAQERLELAQQVAHVGSWEMDVSTGRIEWSREFARSSERDTGSGMPTYADLLALYIPEDAARLNNAVQRAITEAVSYEIDVRRLQKNNTTRTFHAIGRPITDAAGHVIRLTHTSLDITERQELESQLRQVQKMETIGRFAGAIAHDFNNLIAIIMGHAELIADSLLSPAESKQSLESIENAANRAADLTRQLLAFAHKQVNNPVVLQPNDLLVGTTAMLRPIIGQSIELITRFSPNLGNIFIDSNQLEQVIVNLVVNARDAMPHGGKLILQKEDITLKQDLVKEMIPAGRYVVISITDTGVGMSEEVQERLFEPFFTTKEKGKGTGLGLATVYGIVQQNRGYISVQSEVDVGTKFMVYFPSLDDAPEPDASTKTDLADEDGTETILVVDDEAMIREFIVKALRNHGYRVLEAADGSEALTVVAQHTGEIQLLITDMIMPNVGGVELARRVQEPGSHIAVLFMSGYTEEADSNEILVLRKPFKTAEMLKAVHSLLETRYAAMDAALVPGSSGQ